MLRDLRVLEGVLAGPGEPEQLVGAALAAPAFVDGMT
jgi:hypothetical protein